MPDGDRRRPHPDLADPHRLAALLSEHGSNAAVATAVGVTATTVRRWRERHGLPPATRTGPRSNPRLADRDDLRGLLAEHGSDAAVADALGVTGKTVSHWRRRHGIPAATRGGTRPRPSLADPDRLRDLLAEHGSDPAVADHLGVHADTVAHWRRRHGIPAATRRGSRPHPSLADPDRLRDLLAEHGSDPALADALGVAPGTVGAWRRRHDIPAGMRRSTTRPALADPDRLRDLLAEHGSDRRVAAAVGTTEPTVRRWRGRHGIAPVGRAGRRPSPAPDPDLVRELVREHGSDAAVADHLGVPASAVGRWRATHGIAPGRRPRADADAAAPRRHVDPPDPDRLRALVAEHRSDRAVADVLDVPPMTVFQWRREHGIPAGGGNRKHPDLADPDRLRDLLAEHGSDTAVARAIGTKQPAVTKARHRHGIPAANPPGGKPRGRR